MGLFNFFKIKKQNNVVHHKASVEAKNESTIIEGKMDQLANDLSLKHNLCLRDLCGEQEIVVYFSGREPYPYTKLRVFSNKVFCCESIENQYAGAGDVAKIPEQLIINNRMSLADFNTYINEHYKYMNVLTVDNREINFSSFSIVEKE